MSNTQERVDLYNRNREMLGYTKPRHGEGSELTDDEYMVVVLALLENQDGEILITQRTMDKKWAAGWWEIPGGGASAGETSRDAVNRETMEEVGLDVSGLQPVSIYCYVNQDKKYHDNYFCDIYHFKFDFSLEDVKLQVEETLDGKLATWNEIDKIAETGEFLHYKRLQEALVAEEMLKK